MSLGGFQAERRSYAGRNASALCGSSRTHHTSTESSTVSFLKTEMIFSIAGDVGCWGDALLPCESPWMLLKKNRDSTAHCPRLE